MADIFDRIPVIVGVGQLNDRPVDVDQGLDSYELMRAALHLADADAGGGWLAQADSLAVVDQVSFTNLGDVSARLADAVGAKPKYCYRTPSRSGTGPIKLLNEAANRIAAGDIKVAVIVGGEALRTASGQAAAAAGGDPSAYNVMRSASDGKASSYRLRYGLTAPADIYPLYENASRAAWGQTLQEAQAETGAIWSLFSEVAAANPSAWLRRPMTAEEIIQPSAVNRPIAFPYLKFMVANSSVNQGAGFIVTSLAEARRRHVPEHHMIYVGYGAAADEPENFLKRDGYDRSCGMEVSLIKAMRLNGLTAEDLSFAELYSCFPCVPKLSSRIIDWPLDKPATVFGGLTFGGGPIGNYMSHAVSEMTCRLRDDGGKGLLFANGGVLTHNHTITLSSEPSSDQAGDRNYDFQSVADAKRGPVPVVDEHYRGRGTIETYTILYERDGSPRFGVIVGRNSAGSRFLAKVPGDDHDAIAFLSDGRIEPVGTRGEAVESNDCDVLWRISG